MQNQLFFSKSQINCIFINSACTDWVLGLLIKYWLFPLSAMSQPLRIAHLYSPCVLSFPFRMNNTENATSDKQPIPALTRFPRHSSAAIPHFRSLPLLIGPPRTRSSSNTKRPHCSFRHELDQLNASPECSILLSVRLITCHYAGKASTFSVSGLSSTTDSTSWKKPWVKGNDRVR